jgi:GAF domain-containing protein
VAYQYTPRGIRGVAEGIHAQPERDLTAPLAIRGQQIGSISIKREAAEGWSDVDRDLAQKVAAQVALALENNRLLEETRDRAMYEQRISAISDRLGQSVDIDGLLQTAARELAALPEVSDASVVLNPDLKVR